MSADQASVPEVPVRGSSRLNIASSTGVGPSADSAPSCSQRQRITAAVAATTPGNGRRSPCGGKRISKARSSATVASASSFKREPGRVVGAHVHRQRLGHRTQAARLLGAVDPDLERLHAASARPRRPPAVRRRRARSRRTDARSCRSRPRCRPAGRADPASAATRAPAPAGGRARGAGSAPCAVSGAGCDSLVVLSTEPSTAFGPVGRQALQARLPGLHVQVLEVGERDSRPAR